MTPRWDQLDEEPTPKTCGECGTMTAPADDNRRDQTPTCATAERERLTRERDEARAERDQALMLLGVYKTRSGDLLARVKRLEEAGDAILWYFRPKDTGDISFLQSEAMKQWAAAKDTQ